MNLRQAQRSLAELMSKCEETHIQLPKVNSSVETMFRVDTWLMCAC
jgi:hypothetical protein